MLYVSRLIGDNIGVVDTDDDVETVISRDYLKSVINSGLVIKGVETSGRCPTKSIVKIHPVLYRDKAKSIKSLFFYGFEIVVNGGRIVAVNAKGKKSNEKVYIRLSNFSKIIGDDILSRLPRSHTPLVFILDDSVEFSASSFSYWYARGVVLDIRELKSEEKVDMIYSAFTDVDSPAAPSDMFQCLIDDQSRMSGYTALAYTLRGTKCDQWYQKQRLLSPASLISDHKFASAFLFKRLRSAVEQLADSEFEGKSGIYAEETKWNFIRQYGGVDVDEIDMRIAIDDGWPFARYDCIVEAMAECSICDGVLLRRWFYAIRTFFPSQEDLDIYVRFCRRAYTFLIEW